MAVDGADIGKPKRFEEGAADGHAFDQIFGAFGAFPEGFRQKRHRAFGGGFQILERGTCVELREVGRQGTDRRGDAHLVIVQDHKEPFVEMSRIVHSFEGHAGAHGPVADHGHCVTDAFGREAAQITGDGEPKGRAYRGRTMRCSEGVVGAF